MNALEMRSEFRRFAGEERYRKFVRAINRASRSKGRLLYWQEDLWAEFLSSCSLNPLSSAEIIECFSVCDIHDCKIQVSVVNEAIPKIRHTPEVDEAFEELFPFASDGRLTCPECDIAREAWVSQHEDLCRILRCRTTYEDYVTRQLAEFDTPTPSMVDKIRMRGAEIVAHMQPGDELWEWDEGGWHCLSGRAGLTIVRDGVRVKTWCNRAS